MNQLKAMRKGFAGMAIMLVLILVCTLGLAACAPAKSSGGAQTPSTSQSSSLKSGAGKSADQNRVDAKTVIRAASDIFTISDLGLTDADSGAIIAMNDPEYSEFFEQLQNYGDVSDLNVSDATFVVDIKAVEAATARGSETNYRYTIRSADVTVNGKHATYNDEQGLVLK